MPQKSTISLKNSEMTLHAILANPGDLDAYRAHADALIEEGEEEKGNYLASRLGKPAREVLVTRQAIEKKTTPPFVDLKRLLMFPDLSWVLTIKNGFVTRIRLPLYDFVFVRDYIFKQQPIQGVQLIDRVPRNSAGKAYWYEGDERNGRPYSLYTSQFQQRLLPNTILARFPIDTPLVHSPAMYGTAYRFDSTREAIQAVSVACVRLGREKAGLARLPEDGYARIRPCGLSAW